MTEHSSVLSSVCEIMLIEPCHLVFITIEVRELANVFICRALLASDQDPTLFLRLNGVEFPIGRATIYLVVEVHVEAAQSNLSCKLTSNNDLEVSSCTLKELFANVDHRGTVLVIHNDSHLVMLEHRVAVSPVG